MQLSSSVAFNEHVFKILCVYEFLFSILMWISQLVCAIIMFTLDAKLLLLLLDTCERAPCVLEMLLLLYCKNVRFV